MKPVTATSSLSFFAVGIAALIAGGAAAQHLAPWTKDHQNYELTHPMKISCSEFVGAEDVYQNYITAYLTGTSHSENDVEIVDEGFWVSIPMVVETCSAEPDKSVWEVVNTIVKGHN